MKERWLNLRVDDAILDKLDCWRRDKAYREQTDISRSEAIRLLINGTSEGI